MTEADLRRLLAELAAEDVGALLAETRAGGREDAAVLLRGLWRDAYIEVAGRPAPAATAPSDGTAFWIYCVVGSDAVPELDAACCGVDGETLEIISAGSLAAVVGRVAMGDFADEPLRAHLENLDWVDRVARTHDAVQQAVMAKATIVPLRLCTILLTRERVVALLQDSAAQLTSILGELRGCSEWGLKLFSPAVPSTAAEPAAATGGAYLQQRRAVKAAREEAQRSAADRARQAHDALTALAVRTMVNAPQAREAHGRDADMLLNGAYLIADERRAELDALVTTLAASYDELGYSLELTGPWPPYNFAGSLA
jgi:hypothetical protein